MLKIEFKSIFIFVFFLGQQGHPGEPGPIGPDGVEGLRVRILISGYSSLLFTIYSTFSLLFYVLYVEMYMQ